MLDNNYEGKIHRYHSQCSNCLGILHELRTKTLDTCPLCGNLVEVWQGFPLSSASHLIERINYFYSQAHTKHHHAVRTATEKISQELQREVTEKSVYEGWLRMNKVFAKTHDNEVVSVTLGQFFRCDNVEAIRNVFVIYAQAEFDPPEVEVVPILTVALIESLFNELLREMIRINKHKSYSQAREEVATISSFRERYRMFERLTGQPFRSTVVTIYPPLSKKFWDTWQPVLRKRNDFIHLTPYALSWRICRKAYNVAKVSSSVFVELHNAFARVRP